MTGEEELDWLYRLRSEIYVYMPKEWLIPMNNALDMAISAVKREQQFLDAGYKNGSVEFNIGGRKFVVRELAQ